MVIDRFGYANYAESLIRWFSLVGREHVLGSFQIRFQVVMSGLDDQVLKGDTVQDAVLL